MDGGIRWGEKEGNVLGVIRGGVRGEGTMRGGGGHLEVRWDEGKGLRYCGLWGVPLVDERWKGRGVRSRR